MGKNNNGSSGSSKPQGPSHSQISAAVRGVGFSGEGVHAKTPAASYMASYGGTIPAGSTCARLQHVGAKPDCSKACSGPHGGFTRSSQHRGTAQTDIAAAVGALGFTSQGVKANTPAADFMATYGGSVGSDSSCARLQHIGAKPAPSK